MTDPLQNVCHRTHRSGNIVAEIKAAVDPAFFDFSTAEGRAERDLNDVLMGVGE